MQVACFIKRRRGNGISLTNFHFRLEYEVVTLHSEEAGVVTGESV